MTYKLLSQNAKPNNQEGGESRILIRAGVSENFGKFLEKK